MTRNKKTTSSLFFVISFICCYVQLVLSSPVRAQQTLGGITGTVTDASRGILPDTTVSLVNNQTKLSRTQTANASGIYDFVNFPLAATRSLSLTRDSKRKKCRPSWSRPTAPRRLTRH